MNRKGTVKTYGRHRMRVIAIEGWSSDDDRQKNLFSFSNSDCSSNDSGSVITDSSNSHLSQRITRSTRKQLMAGRRNDNKENRNCLKQTRARINKELYSSDNDSGMKRKGLYDATNQSVKTSSVKTKKSLLLTAKSNNSYNFSELDDYSLVVDSDDSRPKKTSKKNLLKANNLLVSEQTNVETSTPCREANIKINNCDISQIEELVDSPCPSDVSVQIHHNSNRTPKLNLSSISGSPSIESEPSSLHQYHPSISDVSNIAEMIVENNAPINRASLSLIKTHVNKRTRNQLSPSPVSNRTRSVNNRTKSLFDSPELSRHSKIQRTSLEKLECYINLSLLRDSYIADKTNRKDKIKSLFDSSTGSRVNRSGNSCPPTDGQSKQHLTRYTRGTTLDELSEENEEFASEDNNVESSSEISDEDSRHSCSVIQEESFESGNGADDSDYIVEEDDCDDDELCTSEYVEDECNTVSDDDGEIDADYVDKLKVTRNALTELAIQEKDEDWETDVTQSSMESDDIGISPTQYSNDISTDQSENQGTSSAKHFLRIITMDESSACLSPEPSPTGSSVATFDESYHTAVDNSRIIPENSRLTRLRESQCNLKPNSTPVMSPYNLSRSFVEMLTPKSLKGSTDVPKSPRSTILSLCQQQKIVSFCDCIPFRMLNECVKIGEGVYGEVFRAFRNKKSVAIKIVPIEGDFLVNDEKQKTFAEVLPEVLISQELSELRNTKETSTDNFCQVNSVACVKGAYPKQLIKQWDVYDQKKVSENDRPDKFNDNQLFIVFEFADGGCDLQSFEFENPSQAKSVLLQTAFSLAVAEEAFEFEHRDLHIGNVLVGKTDESTITCRVNGELCEIESFGVHVCIIDFTMSRLKKDGLVIHCNLADDETLFQGKGDYQFDIYRLMKDHNRNKWDDFRPYSNILWIHYLTDCILKKKCFKSNSRVDREVLKDIRQIYKTLKEYTSARQLVNESDFFKPS